ncbi:hypothetical protein OK015_04530 [Mycobacterium sp. Aquia_216]|uniref:hypothetical protein n=1 Tax=Mycobacterium sp. Aquia_216 TaxID=2991729 RepID=UPI00227AEE2B|nr:hypothetical protein [Mycobacterium sp. Aquia_216]WAJ45777.1 hypothetical protein OK015_04530 [Mycobacterium sp. Aquia_216]
MPLAAGQEFAGYTILQVLGAGAMGTVYLHPRLPRQDALTVLSVDPATDPQYQTRFLCLFWLSTTTQVFTSLIHAPDGVAVRGGKTIQIADVYESGASAALFTILLTGIMALIRLYSRQPSPR